MEHETTIIDLRGPDSSSPEDGFGVLADPTGRRRRGLRRIGRAVAVLFAIWLAALALAGVGLLPGVGVPLASRSGADGAPPPIDDRSPLVATEGTRPALTRAATATATAAARATPTSARLPPLPRSARSRGGGTSPRAASDGRHRSGCHRAVTAPAAANRLPAALRHRPARP